MVIDIDFKLIKDKRLRALYQIIDTHLKHINNLDSKDALLNYQLLFKAYKNGHTSNNKMFKALLKSHLAFPYIFIDWLNIFVTSKLYYLDAPKLKHLDDLFKYSELQSNFGFLLLITDTLAKQHLTFINDISKLDILSQLLLLDNPSDPSTNIYYPQNMIFDFGIDFSIDGAFMKNEKFVGLWEYLYFKVQGFIKSTQHALIRFQPNEVILITHYLDRLEHSLKLKRTELINHIKTLQLS